MFGKILKFLMNLFKKKQDAVSIPVITSPSSSIPVNGGKPVSKYALLVGVNKYLEPGNDLNGCINDVNDMADYLVKNEGFEPENIRMLCDARATQANILEHLEWLVTSPTNPGDKAVWHNSSHGSYVRHRDPDTGKLSDEIDQIICPYDLDWDNPITDKIIAAYFKKVKIGCSLTFICDSCHSGTIDRDMVSITNNPHYKKAKFIAPPPDILWRSKCKTEVVGDGLKFVLPVAGFGVKSNGTKIRDLAIPNVTFVEMNHVLLSGCRDDQTSADAFINGRYNGALTAMILDAMKNKPSNCLITHKSVLELLKRNGYSQIPQLTGSKSLLDGGMF